MSFDLTDYQVGDEFEGSPIDLGRVISAILTEDGTFYYEGKSIIITSLPNRKVEEKPTKVEEVKVEEVKVEEVKVEEVKVEEPEKEVEKEKEPEKKVAKEPEKEKEPESEPIVEETPSPVKETKVSEIVVEKEPVKDSEVARVYKPKGRPRKTAPKIETE